MMTVLASSLPIGGSQATEINAISARRVAVLGSAYRHDREDFPGEACITGDSTPAGTTTSNFTFQNSISENQATKELGLEAGGRSRIDVVEVSASATFLQNSVSSAYSVSSIWISDYVLPTDKLTNRQFTPIGEALKDNFERWPITCGDEAVIEITRGAKLFFSIRVDFRSREQKQAFEGKFSISGPLASANATLRQATSEFSRDTQVTISAFQQGGDVSKVTALFNNGAQGATNFVQCTLGNFEQCATVVGAALSYATDTTNGFPSKLLPALSRVVRHLSIERPRIQTLVYTLGTILSLPAS
jgi:hypothetical protein